MAKRSTRTGSSCSARAPRGDYNPHSDIDLLIITDFDSTDKQEYQDTSVAAHRKAEELYGDLIGVDLLTLSEKAFHDGRRARNHVAGQAVRDGLDGNGDKVDYDSPNPTTWPDVRQRISIARRCLNDLEVLVGDSRSSRRPLGFTLSRQW